jgi:hypothetical protein
LAHKQFKNFKREQRFWYNQLKRDGFVDLEEGHDNDVLYSYTPGAPQFAQDRNFEKFQRAHRAPTEQSDGAENVSPRFFESAQAYYEEMSTLTANWPRRWLRTKLQRLEYRIVKAHSEGQSGNKIYKAIKAGGKRIPGKIGSLRSVRRVIEKYRVILKMLPFERLENWEPGHAVEQILDSSPDLKNRIIEVLVRRQVK